MTASTSQGHDGAVALDAPAALSGVVYVRLIAQVEPLEELPSIASVEWTYDGQPVAGAAAAEWDQWEHDDAIIGGWLYAPPIDVDELGPEPIPVAVRILCTDGAALEYGGFFALPPEPEPEPRHPLVDHVVAAGGTARLADLVERRVNGDPLTNAEGAELLAALPSVDVDGLDPEAALALADVVDAVNSKQASDAEVLGRLKGLASG